MSLPPTPRLSLGGDTDLSVTPPLRMACMVWLCAEGAAGPTGCEGGGGGGGGGGGTPIGGGGGGGGAPRGGGGETTSTAATAAGSLDLTSSSS